MSMALLPPMATSLLLSSTILLITFLSISTSQAQAPPIYRICSNSAGNYTANSTFQTNLKLLLTSLTSNASTTGYADGSLGNVPDRIYGLALCRGDVNASACQSCLANAAEDIQQMCPYTKEAKTWYDSCLMRYSNQRLAGVVDNTGMQYMWNVNNVTSSEWPSFNASLVRMMDDLTKYAAYNTSASPPRMFATGEVEGFSKEYQKIYGLVQCTRDLSADDCNRCLEDILTKLPSCCSEKVGGRVLATSCNFRYEVEPFYSGSAKLSVRPVAGASAPPPLINTTDTGNSTGGGKKKIGTGTILAIVIPLGIVFVLFVICCAYCPRRMVSKTKYYKADRQDIAAIESLLFDLPTIRYATDNFSVSNKLGQGGFGVVYKGILPDGQEIAVKRLSAGSVQGIGELRNEVVLLAKLQHRNLVRLLGVCWDEEEKLLIYEFVENKSLDNFLFDPTKKEQLYWERRYKIIGGIAQGLLYLHEESQHKIVHRDLKASNTLLDADMNPKIADFGTARLFGGDQTQASTNRIVGTFGYMSPEYVMRGHFSAKSDVFSFGVLVLEIVTGRKINNFFGSGNSTDLLSYVWQHWSDGTISDVLDPSFSGSCPQSEALRCIQIGLLCVEESPADRPTMSSVVLMLNSFSVSIQVPSRPAFINGYNRMRPIEQLENSDISEGRTSRSTNRSEFYSRNEVSVTELDPR